MDVQKWAIRAADRRPVIKDRELMILDLSVVDDPGRTIEPCDRTADDLPVWSFGWLMSRIAEQAGSSDPSAFVLRWLETWDRDQEVNGFPVPSRERMRPIITDPWLRASGGPKLDLRKAPFRLAAIVNRMDLRRSDGDRPLDAGEGRFVFNAVDQDCRRLSFTLVLEFKLRAAIQDEVLDWARGWHALGDLDFGPSFNDALQRITDSFVRDFSQLRTNELDISFLEWEERAFGSEGKLELIPTTMTPDISLNGSTGLATYINEHAQEILAERHQVPPEMLGGWAQAAVPWDSLEIEDRFEARHHFAIQTCNGCHSAETGTPFVHVGPRRPHEMADLSDYLTGLRMPVLDALDQPRTFNELQRRADLLQRLLDEGFFSTPRRSKVH